MRNSTLAVAAIALAAVVPTSAFAEDPDCTAAGGSSATPHVNDPAGDWNGLVFGNESALIPYGDVHREGTDILTAWISLADGKYYANLSVGTLDGTQVNTTYGVRWLNAAGPAAQARRFVQVQFSERGAPTYEHGYLAVDPQTEIDNVNTVGTTRGTVSLGSPGIISIEIPFGAQANRIPKPLEMEGVTAETRVLLGARGTGLLGLADSSDDGDGPCFNIIL